MFYLFHHIPKTAGSSCVQAFRKLLKVIPDYHKSTTPADLTNYSECKKDLAALCSSDMLWGHYNIPGHYLYQRYPSLDNYKPRKIIFFRDPTETALSGIRYGIKRGVFNVSDTKTLLRSRVGYFNKMLQCDRTNYKDVIDSYYFVGISDDLQMSFNSFINKACLDGQVIIERLNSSDGINVGTLTCDDILEFKERNILDCEIFAYARLRANRLIQDYS